MAVDPRPQRVTLSRDLSEFLVELSIAVQKRAMYPSGHPSLRAAMQNLTARAGRLLAERPTMVFGVARRQLIIDSVATDPDHPVLRRLAEALHRHHLGAISFSHGLQPEEMDEALRALATEVEHDGPLGLQSGVRSLAWPHVVLHPLAFDRLELKDESSQDAPDSKADARAAALWVDLAAAAMAANPQTASAATDPSALARAIDEQHGTEAYDQVIVGYLLKIADELKSASSAEAAALRKRTAELIAALRPETLRRLVAMGGDAARRRQFVLDAVSTMEIDAVIEILKAAAEASGQTISHGLVRMLAKLADHAGHGSETVKRQADEALRDQVVQLLAEWRLEDPNPDAYSKVLHRLATAGRTGAPAAARRTDDQDALRIVQMSLEVGQFGPLVDRAMDEVIRDGRCGSVLRLLASMPRGCVAVAEGLLAKMLAPDAVAALAAREPLDADALDQLLPMISIEAYEVLLDALATSRNKISRRQLLERLPKTDLDVGPLIVSRLEDRRWYVVRNMLVLLQRVRRLPAGFSPLPWLDHADPRVRLEAIQLAFAVPAEREAALKHALADHDARILRVGLAAAQRDCPRGVARLVIGVAHNPKMSDDLRVLAARALARCREGIARDALLKLVDGGKTLLGRPRLAPPTPLCVAAVRALAEGWAKDPAASAALQLAAASPDPDLRQAAAEVTTS